MAAAVRDSFLDLERQRQKLQGQVDTMRKSLGYWRTWDADYEGILEELKNIPEGSRTKSDAVLGVKAKVASDILSPKELDQLFGTENAPIKFAQVLRTIEGRIDTASKNIATIEKGLESLENKLAGIQVIMNPEVEDDEDGQPITDIIEELDDDDNVISYRLQKPGDNTQQIRELLKKAGVKDIPGEEDTDAPQKALEKMAETVSNGKVQETDKPKRAKLEPSEKQIALDNKAKKAIEKEVSERSTTNGTSKQSPEAKKSVAPTNGKSKQTPEPKKPSKPTPQTPSQPTETLSPAAQRVQNIVNTALEQEELAKQPAVIPDDEDPADAQMRQDMLKYGLGEVGAVVAEMFLDDDEAWTDEEEEYESDESDEFGQSKYSVLTDDYRQHMMDLEKRLGIQSRFTRDWEEKLAGIQDDGDSDEEGEKEKKTVEEGVGRIVIQTENGTPEPKKETSVPEQTDPSTSEPLPLSVDTTTPEDAPNTDSPPQTPGPKSNLKKAATPTTEAPTGHVRKKSVHFAEMLDIAPRRPGEKAKSNVRAKIPRLDTPTVEPHSDIVERKGPSKSSNKKKKGKMSSFRKAMAAASPAMTPDAIPAAFALDENKVQGASAPTPPEGETLAASVIERATPRKADVLVNDEIDEWQLRDEVADEYHRRRNKMILGSGGFKEEEKEIERVEDGPVKRVSRFKAARLGKQ